MARGFAGMSPERRAEVSQRGGLARAAKGVGHQFTSDEARAAVKKRYGASAQRPTPPPVQPARPRAPKHPLADIEWPE